MDCAQTREEKAKEPLASPENVFTLRPALTEIAGEDSDLSSLYELPEFKALLVKQYVSLRPVEVRENMVRVN
jgi:hypothetical protein